MPAVDTSVPAQAPPALSSPALSTPSSLMSLPSGIFRWTPEVKPPLLKGIQVETVEAEEEEEEHGRGGTDNDTPRSADEEAVELDLSMFVLDSARTSRSSTTTTASARASASPTAMMELLEKKTITQIVGEYEEQVLLLEDELGAKNSDCLLLEDQLEENKSRFSRLEEQLGVLRFQFLRLRTYARREVAHERLLSSMSRHEKLSGFATRDVEIEALIGTLNNRDWDVECLQRQVARLSDRLEKCNEEAEQYATSLAQRDIQVSRLTDALVVRDTKVTQLERIGAQQDSVVALLRACLYSRVPIEEIDRRLTELTSQYEAEAEAEAGGNEVSTPRHHHLTAGHSDDDFDDHDDGDDDGDGDDDDDDDHSPSDVEEDEAQQFLRRQEDAERNRVLMEKLQEKDEHIEHLEQYNAELHRRNERLERELELALLGLQPQVEHRVEGGSVDAVEEDDEAVEDGEGEDDAE